MQKLIKVAALPIFFDNEILSFAINEPISEFEFNRLLSLSAIRPYDEEKEFYSIHEIARNILIKSIAIVN